MHSVLLAAQLQLFEREYEMVIYNEPSHSLPFKYFDSFDRMFAWFEQHKRKPVK